MAEELLHKKIADSFNLFQSPPEIPGYITDNLGHDLRPYQQEALEHFIFAQESDNANMSFNHLLFHMATGSGKTLVLAATMLYLFKQQNQQNFIFFVNTDAIIRKTFDNLTNVSSSKYLFTKDGITIDGEKVDIQIVDVFPILPDKNTIYLKLTTIQKLHLDLTEPRENSLTFESLEEDKVVLLADEAHHINALTKRDKRKLNTKEAEEKTWENTVSKLLSLNPENRLLEFTATIDLTKDVLFDKYRDKIVYQYDLKHFMNDGYSKNVMLLRADEDDERKMFHAVLLSQYRKYIAQDNYISLKPVILFKSNKIATSVKANETLLSLIQGLTLEKLTEAINYGYSLYQHNQGIWGKMFHYYQSIDLSHVLQDLKWDFTEGTTINANSKEFLSEDNALMLNSLEEPNNPIRTIFAVAKLNEGWDVLNLFDIVRVSEGASTTKSTTDSEAQLIGRGARYFPFKYEEEQSYKRRFDPIGSDLKALESLHYHTINTNAYIKNLNKSLEAANIQVKEDSYERLEAKIKANFKKHPIFKNGKIYINKLVQTTTDDFDTLEKYSAFNSYDISFQPAIEQQYGKSLISKVNYDTHILSWKIEPVYKQKAIQRNTFFKFDNFKHYVPALTSIKDFLTSPDFLGEATLKISVPISISIEDLKPAEKLKMVDQFFEYLEKKIRLNYSKERGTPVFEGVAFSELVNDYYVEMNKVNANVSDMSEVKQPRSMRQFDWFIYDKAIVNNLEDSFIDFMNDYIEELRKKYDDVYLIRNERKIKIVEVDGVRGFMPDFLLFMKDENYTYQVFLEPKGDHLRLTDKWKEDFLTSLLERDDIEVLSENEDVRLLGLRFYSDTTQYKNEFREDFEKYIVG
ncbi:DEAD/DEAH box helicase family protein [Alkalibacterium psychrotolerans]